VIRAQATRRGERGAATILVIAMAGVLLLVGSALGVVQAMVVAHRRAQAAADLAALAGASASMRGEDPCEAARVVARLNDAVLLACASGPAAVGGTVTVRVRVPGPQFLGRHDNFDASARAGPS
jgi:secretion/DNA translocation related TadE-like protein